MNFSRRLLLSNDEPIGHKGRVKGLCLFLEDRAVGAGNCGHKRFYCFKPSIRELVCLSGAPNGDIYSAVVNCRIYKQISIERRVDLNAV